uniref:BPTI/Kunitz inhibitor domain-containing protein n=1 Tax=Parascaris equorum TaxID=6256 RepID=A0A914S0L1_PAREQ
MPVLLDFTHLCEGGIPLLLENDRPKPCSPHPAFSALQCPNNFWCHLGSTNTTNYCCPKNRKGICYVITRRCKMRRKLDLNRTFNFIGKMKNRCHLPPTVGLGRGKMRRYAYDLTSGLCKELIYTGYGGNENNFLTITDCQRACLTSSPAPKISLSKKLTKSEDKNPCELTPDRGSPKQDIPPSLRKKQEKINRGCTNLLRWYYDVAATRCMQFHFLGSDGNGNNFEREHMCMEVCGTG